MVGNHWEPERRDSVIQKHQIKKNNLVVYRQWVFFKQAGIRLALTDCCKDVSETEIVHSIEGQQVVKKLLLLIITAEEGVALVQFSKKKRKKLLVP